VFVTGLTVFALASLLIGVAPAGWWLIAARALQGIGAAIVAPSSLALLTAVFPEGAARSRAVALYAATAGIGASLGLVVGGLAADLISWRAGFFLNVPIGVAMIILAPRFLPETTRTTGRFDVKGATGATLGVGAVVFGIIHAADNGWGSAGTLTATALGVLLLVGLVLTERRAAQPIMPLELFANRRRVGAYLSRLLYLGAMIGFFFFFTTQFLQNVLGFTALQAGLAFLPMTIVNFVVAMLVPRLLNRWGQVPALSLGVGLTLVGMYWLSRVGVDSEYVAGVALPMVLIGAGQGFAFTPMTSIGLVGVRPDQAGAASGLINTFHQLGSALGLGVLVAVSTAAGAATTPPAAALVVRIHVALTAGTVQLGFCLIAVLSLSTPLRFRRPALQTATA